MTSFFGLHALYNDQDTCAGEPLKWTLYIQTMDPAKENDYDFDPMDSTKAWPEDEFPLHEVGQMVLDRNVDNWHNENEMIAFSPGMLPPGKPLSPELIVPGLLSG